MWIIPKKLHTSHYVVDMKGLGVDCEQFSQLSEKSLMWRSKPTASPTWSKRWKRVSSIKPLSTLILKPSHTESFVERWTFSLEDSLASHSQMLECVKELKTLDTSSPTSQEESESANLELFSSKMLKELSQPKQPMENQFSNMSSENWKDWVTKQRQEYSQRAKLAHHTKEKGSSSWDTPRVGGVDESWETAEKRGRTSNLYAQMDKIQKKKNWATPRASATDSTRPNGKGGIPLADQVKNWATPNTMDTLPPRSYEAAMRQATTSRKGRTEPSNLREQVDETTVQAYKDANSFPTPRTSDAEGGRIETIVEDGVFKSKRHKSNQTFGAKLRDAVETYEEKNWPTPQVGEEKASRPRILGGTQNQVMLSQVAIEDSIARTQDSQQDQTSHSTSGKPQGAPKLNPDWVEQLMGLPIGSTDLGYWGTGSCHK